MTRSTLHARVAYRWLIAVSVFSFLIPALPNQPVQAVPTLINSAGNQIDGSNNVSATLPTAATAGNLIVVICTIAANATVTTPSGFSTARAQVRFLHKQFFINKQSVVKVRFNVPLVLPARCQSNYPNLTAFTVHRTPQLALHLEREQPTTLVP